MTPFNAICIDNDGIDGYFKEGEIYLVMDENGAGSWLVSPSSNECSFWLRSDRFKRIDIAT